MGQVKRGRLSPALVISMLALVAAFAGVAVADPGANSSASAKKTAKKALKKAKAANKTAKRALARSVSGVDSVLSGPALDDQGVKVADVTLTTATQTRILASASAVIGNDIDDAAICWLNAGGAVNNVDNDISQRVFAGVPDAVVDFAELSVNGSVVKPAGTHTVALYCASTTGDPVVDRIDLIAWTSAA